MHRRGASFLRRPLPYPSPSPRYPSGLVAARELAPMTDLPVNLNARPRCAT